MQPHHRFFTISFCCILYTLLLLVVVVVLSVRMPRIQGSQYNVPEGTIQLIPVVRIQYLLSIVYCQLYTEYVVIRSSTPVLSTQPMQYQLYAYETRARTIESQFLRTRLQPEIKPMLLSMKLLPVSSSPGFRTTGILLSQEGWSQSTCSAASFATNIRFCWTNELTCVTLDWQFY